MSKKKKPMVRDHAFYVAIGSIGGKTTKQKKLRDNPNYYSEIGTAGGMTMKRTRGKAFYSMIGKMGKQKRLDKGQLPGGLHSGWTALISTLKEMPDADTHA